MASTTYARPGFFTARIVNPLVALLTGGLGVDLKGTCVLAVRGRVTGDWRSTPVTPVTWSGDRYLVAPRGETHWARNLRASGEARLTFRGRTDTVRVEEVPDGEKAAILRTYLGALPREVGRFFPGVDPGAPDHAFARLAPRYPVFRIVSR
jgi:deazaflavin-dependent oxidoreductase (nitroreductase family)